MEFYYLYVHVMCASVVSKIIIKSQCVLLISAISTFSNKKSLSDFIYDHTFGSVLLKTYDYDLYFFGSQKCDVTCYTKFKRHAISCRIHSSCTQHDLVRGYQLTVNFTTLLYED